jgi:hypothetical protein
MAPMWRNGRRNGLKIRSREGGVWVRIPSSAPLKRRFTQGNSLGFAISAFAHCRARKRTKRPSIRKYSSVRRRTSFRIALAMLFTSTMRHLGGCRRVRPANRRLVDARFSFNSTAPLNYYPLLAESLCLIPILDARSSSDVSSESLFLVYCSASAS